jgi:Na+/phosphate symporter
MKDEDVKVESKEVFRTCHDIGKEIEDCIKVLQTAFNYHTVKPLGECKEKTEKIITEEPRVTQMVTALVRNNPDMKPYVSVPVHLLRITENVVKLSEAVEKKVKGGILFSEKAVVEMNFLFQRLLDIIRPTADIIMARSSYLSQYVRESEANLTRIAIEYTTFHEERLIEGLCLPVSSSIYIGMLDAIKGIAWHAKEIAVKLSG